LNPGTIAYTTIQGTDAFITSSQVIKGLKIASKGTLIIGVGVDIGLAFYGDTQAAKYLFLNTMVSSSCFLLGGPIGLVVGVSYLVLKDQGYFERYVTPQYYQNNYIPNTIAPQDVIKQQYQFKDGFQTIYINH